VVRSVPISAEISLSGSCWVNSPTVQESDAPPGPAGASTEVSLVVGARAETLIVNQSRHTPNFEAASISPEKEVAELDEQSAQKLAGEKAFADAIEPSPGDKWTVRRFSDGWLVSLGASDPLASTGGHHFIVLDSGSVFRESGSMPPFEYVAKHSGAGRGLFLAVDGGHLSLDEQGEVVFETK
jgi:hypothetical protein